MQPVQRIMRYPMFLAEIKEELNNKFLDSQKIDEALSMVRAKARKGDDLVAIDSIENLPFGLSETGSFVKRERFMLLKSKKYETTLFLFKNFVIFTTNNAVSKNTYFENIYRNLKTIFEEIIVNVRTNFIFVKRKLLYPKIFAKRIRAL